MKNDFLAAVQEFCRERGASLPAIANSSILNDQDTSINESYLFRLSEETGVTIVEAPNALEGELEPLCVGLDNSGTAYLVDSSLVNDGLIRLSIRDTDGWAKSFETLEQLINRRLRYFYLTKVTELPTASKSAVMWIEKAKQALRPVLKDIVIASIFLNLLAIALPLFIMNVYDRVIPNNAIHSLWAMSIGLVIVLFFDFGLRIIRSKYLSISGRLIDSTLNAKLFEKAQSIKESQRTGLSDQLVLFKDFEVVKSFLSSGTLLALADLPFSLIFLAVIFAIGGWVGLVPLFGVVALLTVSLSFRRRFNAISLQSQQQQTRKNALLVEALSKPKLIKTMGWGTKFQRRWEHLSGEVSDSTERSKELTSRLQAITAFVLQTVTLGIIVVGAYAIAGSSMSMGALIASVMISSRMMNPIGQLAYLLSQLELTRRAFESIREWLSSDEEDEQAKTRLSDISDIEISDLSLAHPQRGTKILTSLNLTFRRGERIGIVGRVGSGKTSLLDVLMGFNDAYTGRFTLNGVDRQFLRSDSVRDRFAYLAQDPKLVDGVLMSQFEYSSVERLGLTLAELGVSEIVEKLSGGLGYVINEGGRELSGGQRQLIALAAALVKPSDFVILDEPTSALDNLSEQRAAKALGNLVGDRGLIVATHRTEILKQVDRIIVLDDGRVVLDGATQFVLQKLAQRVPPKATDKE